MSSAIDTCKRISFAAAVLSVSLGCGCASKSSSANKSAAEEAAPAPAAKDSYSHQGSGKKASAPVKVELTSSANSGRTTAVLRIEALADAPRVVGRIKIPTGATLIDGTSEVEIGQMRAGEVKEIKVVINLPEDGADLAGGVDMFVGTGVKLHKSVVLPNGRTLVPQKGTTAVKQIPGKGGTRVHRLKQGAQPTQP